MRVTVIELWGREGMLHYASQLCNGLAQLPGVQVTAVLPRGSDCSLFVPQVSQASVEVVRDATPVQLALAPAKLATLPHFLRTIRRTRPDVIHLNNCHVWYLFALPWLRRRWPIVSTLHDVRPHPGQDNTWRKRREIEASIRGSHQVFVHGEALKAELLALYPRLRAEAVHVVPLGDFSFFARYPAGEVREEPAVLFFGRIRDYKGLDYFLEAAQIVARALPSTRFLIAGDGDLRPYQARLGGRATFEVHNHYLAEPEVARLFRRARVVALPYVEASQSGVVQIASAFAKPVVATPVGCLPDVVIDGQTGLLVPPRDGPALAEAILRLLNDPGLRERLGGNAHRRMVEEFGWAAIAARTADVYRAALREFRPAVAGEPA